MTSPSCCCHSCSFKKHKLTIFHTFSLSYRYLFFLVEMELILMTDVPSVDPQANMSFMVWFKPLCVVISGQAMGQSQLPARHNWCQESGSYPLSVLLAHKVKFYWFYSLVFLGYSISANMEIGSNVTKSLYTPQML